MATLSQLVTTMAHSTGLPEATVFAYGRFAREAGYISQAGRGRGGAVMTPTDAANLLIGVCGTRVTREAGAAIAAFRVLKGTIVDDGTDRPHEQIQRWLKKYNLYAASRDISGTINFGKFMDFLVAEASSSHLDALLRSLPVYDAPSYTDPRFHEIAEKYFKDRSSMPFKEAEGIDLEEDFDIRLVFRSNPNSATFYLSSSHYPFESSFLAIKFGHDDDCNKHPDLQAEISVSQRTLFSVGLVLSA